MGKEQYLKEFGSRIKYARQNKEWSQEELANRLGTSKSVISGYETGRNDPAQSMVMKLSETLNVSINWLMYGEDQNVYIKNIIPIKKSTKKVPLVGTIAAGPPILAEENIEEYIDIDEKVNADFCLRVSGDSMINADIKNNDIVFIKKQSDVDDGEIAAVLIDGEATLKRVFKIGNIVQLRAENPAYSPILLNGDTPVLILGKATYKLSKVL